jgi:hypothetical protein
MQILQFVALASSMTVSILGEELRDDRYHDGKSRQLLRAPIFCEKMQLESGQYYVVKPIDIFLHVKKQSFAMK